MNILVTGGAGFIGSHLVDRLIDEGHTVTVFDDLSGGYLKNVNPQATFIEIDCRNSMEVDASFKGFDVVYHLAANAAENKAQYAPVDVTSRGYQASINVLASAIRHQVKKFIFTSSIAVYGHGQTPFKESDKPVPEDLYGIGKLAFEESLKVMAKVHNFEYVILRPHNVYGPRQNMSDPFRNVVTIFMNAILKDKPYVLYGHGLMTRCFTYIDDITECLYQSLNLSNITLNIGSSVPTTIFDLSTLIQKISGGHVPPQFLPARPQEVMHAVSDHTLSHKHLKYTETELSDGLKKTWKWVESIGPVETKYDKLEILNNLPSNWK